MTKKNNEKNEQIRPTDIKEEVVDNTNETAVAEPNCENTVETKTQKDGIIKKTGSFLKKAVPYVLSFGAGVLVGAGLNSGEDNYDSEDDELEEVEVADEYDHNDEEEAGEE